MNKHKNTNTNNEDDTNNDRDGQNWYSNNYYSDIVWKKYKN